jgi:hypothetical protein
MCMGWYQWSRDVVTARVQTDDVQSLHHQRRDLHKSTYLYLSKDRDSSYYHLVLCLNRLLLDQWYYSVLIMIAILFANQYMR